MTVTKQLIDNVNKIKTTLNEISVYNLDVKTAIELYYELAKKVNEVINELSRFEGVVSDEVIKQNEKLIYLLGEGLKEQVVIKIDNLIKDGTIQDLINNKIFNELNNKIETFKQEVDEQFNTNTNYFQNQINELVLASGGDNNLEVVQTRNDLYGNVNPIMNDRMNNIERILQNNTYQVNLKLKQGSITATTTSGVSVSKTRLASPHYLINSDKLKFNITDGYKVYIWFYNDTESVATVGRGWYSGSFERDMEGKYARFVIAKTDDSNITPEEYNGQAVITFTDNNYLNELKNEINITKGEVVRVEDRVNKLVDKTVPIYWEEHLSSKIKSIQDKEDLIGSGGDSFVFLTDVHWESNAKNSPILIDKILKNTNIDKIFMGGDILNQNETIDIAKGYMRDFYNSFDKNTRLFSVSGNHDWNNNVGSLYPDARLYDNDVYSIMFRNTEKYINTNKKMYYYVDNESQKIRYVVLDDGHANLQTDQKTWLKNLLTTTETGWTIVIFVHRYFGNYRGGSPSIMVYGTTINDTINEVYDSIKATLSCIICGHTHFDYSTTSDKGYPIIVTSCDAYGTTHGTYGQVMELGTTTEQLFDVFTIDTTNKKIYATRVGAGQDREWTY